MNDVLNILLLEDSEFDAKLIRQHIQQGGLNFNLHHTRDKNEFLEALEKDKFHVVLSDDNLPGYDSLTAWEDVKKAGNHAPFIIITGKPTVELIGNVFHAGVDDYMIKDHLARLPKAITNALQKKQAEHDKQVYLKELAASEQRYRQTLDNMMEGVQIHDFNWRYTYVNNAQLQYSRYKREELIGFTLMEKYPGIEQTEVFSVFERCMLNRPSENFETAFVFPDGSTGYFELSIQPVPEGLFILSVDKTEQNKAHNKLLNANRRFSFISGINQSIVHITEEEKLLTSACNLGVNRGKYKLAWIGLLDENNKLNLDYIKGDEPLLQDMLKFSGIDYTTPVWCDTVTGRSISTGILAVSNDAGNDPSMKNFHQLFEQHGINACISLPLKKFSKVIGVYGVCSVTKNYFDEEEMALLEEAAGDISFALEIMQKDIERKKAEDMLKHTRQLLNEAQHIAMIGNWNFDALTGELYWSDGLKEIYGLDKNFVPTVDYYLSVALPEHRAGMVRDIEEAKQQGSSIESYFSIVQPGGAVKALKARTNGIRNGKGQLVRLYGVIQDITELKIAQDELNNTLAELEQRVADRTKELAQSNKNILDSIMYAQRIQQAMFPDIQQLRRIFSHAFIMSRPQEIVGGDFCWFYRSRKKIYLVCADCTGHGVPGAFMSIVGIQLLNKIIIDQDWKYPSLLLELMDDAIFNTLKEKKGDVVKDGMDLCFCVIDTEHKKIAYSGAMLPMVIVRQGIATIYTASRFGLGKYMDAGKKRFDTHEFDYLPGDMLYMFSDGFRDQFGGEKNKKLGLKAFVEILAKISSVPTDNKKAELLQYLDNWKGANHQVDDILVMGVEL